MFQNLQCGLTVRQLREDYYRRKRPVKFMMIKNQKTKKENLVVVGAEAKVKNGVINKNAS